MTVAWPARLTVRKPPVWFETTFLIKNRAEYNPVSGAAKAARIQPSGQRAEAHAEGSGYADAMYKFGPNWISCVIICGGITEER